jgi:hypothetical protein
MSAAQLSDGSKIVEAARVLQGAVYCLLAGMYKLGNACLSDRNLNDPLMLLTQGNQASLTDT